MTSFRNTGQPDWGWWGRLWPTPGECLRSLGVSSGDTVIDLCCGDGYFTFLAARTVEPAKVYAVDIDGCLLDRLDRIATEQGIENIETTECDARTVGRHIEGKADAVLIANTLHGVEDPVRFVGQMSGLLNSGGHLIVINWRNLPMKSTSVEGEPRGPPTELRLSMDETESIVAEKDGFDLKERVDLPPYHYGLVFER
ncbi:MAG: class I SAM-dependent methyltransferase [Halobacteria archaeon]